MTALDLANWLIDLKAFLIPVATNSKISIVAYRNYTNKIPIEKGNNMTINYLINNNNANYGIRTGTINNIVVLDIDIRYH